MKLNLGAGKGVSPPYMPGFENLDRCMGWTFESGLPYPDNSVEGVTISHALVCLSESQWDPSLAEIYRVLVLGGVVRITEDDHENNSRRCYVPWPANMTLTGPKMMRERLQRAGFTVHDVGREETHFKDRSLIQAYRTADPPYYFFMEGVK